MLCIVCGLLFCRFCIVFWCIVLNMWFVCVLMNSVVFVWVSVFEFIMVMLLNMFSVMSELVLVIVLLKLSDYV